MVDVLYCSSVRCVSLERWYVGVGVRLVPVVWVAIVGFDSDFFTLVQVVVVVSIWTVGMANMQSWQRLVRMLAVD